MREQAGFINKAINDFYHFLNVRFFFFFFLRFADSDFVSIDLSGRFRRVRISIATVGPHCTGALVCTVTYWWLTETVIPPVERGTDTSTRGTAGSGTGARSSGG